MRISGRFGVLHRNITNDDFGPFAHLIQESVNGGLKTGYSAAQKQASGRLVVL